MANSYGVIRRTIILGEAGTTWYVNLHKKDYTGTQESMTLFGEGFDLKWSGSGGTRDRRFIESECIVNFTVQNDTDESLLYDIFEKGDRNYFIRVYKNEETTNGLWWFGWVHPSFSTIENAPYPYKSKISATDSVGTFKKSADSELTTAQYNNTSNINTHIKSFGDEMGVYQGWATNLVDNGYFSLPQSNWVLDSPSTWSISSGSFNTPSIGDSVGGGIVFKVVGNKVYISSEVDLSINYEWGCSGTSISGADGSAIGTGEQNTLDIVAGCSDTDIAAYMCESSVVGGFSDWFLPSVDELSEMYDNKDIIGGFSTNHYWSSTEYFSSFAKVVKFSSGTVSNLSKSSTKPVRPIRSYTITSGGGKADAASGVAGYMSQTGVSVTQNQTVSFTFTVQNYNSATNTLTLKNESGQDLATAIDITSDGTYVKTFDSLQNATEIRLHSSFGGSYSITNVTLVDGLVDTAPMPQITNWFYTSIDWWRNGDTYQSDDPFYLYRIGRTLFRDDAEDFPSKYSKYKVLDGALKIFNTVGVLSNGRYNFMQPNQYADNTSGDFRFYQYATGSSRDTSATTENHLLTLDGTVGANTGAVMSGSTLTYEPPFKSVSATYSGGQAIISIPNDVDFSTFTPVGDVQFDGNSTGSLSINFNIEHRERLLASDVDSLLLSGYNLTNHSFRTSTTLIVKLSDGVSQYTLRKLINNSWVWEESSMLYTVPTPAVGYGHPLSNNYVYETSPCQIWLDSNGDYYNAVTKFSVPVLPIPPPPITGVISIKLTGGNNYFQWIDSGTSFGSFSTFNQNSVAITSTNHIINSYFISNNSGAFTSGTSGLKYSVINDDITSEESFDFGNILIGNNNSSTSSNNQNQEAVQYLDSSGNSVASYQGFSQGNSGVYTNITRLLCDQFLSLQKEPLEILQANIFSPDISPLKLLKYSINDDSTYKYYSFLGGSFKAQSETMSGEWFKVNDYTSSIDEDTEMEPEVESESSSNKVSVTKLNLIEQNVSLENAITDIDVEIDLNTSINKINCSSVSRGKVYNNQKLILRSPNNFEYLVVTVSQDTAIGASAINITPITTTSIFPIGSTLSVLTYDLSNVITGAPSGTPHTVKVNISQSEYAALDTIPKVLIPAPGVGKTIVPSSIMIFAKRNTTETSRYHLFVGDRTNEILGSYHAKLIEFMASETGDRTYMMTSVDGETIQATPENKKLQMYSNRGFNGSIELTVYVTYTIMDI